MATPALAAQAPDYVRRISPYVGGKPIEEVARELGLDPASIVKLASNENPRGPSPKAVAAIAAVPPHVLVVLDEAYNEYLEPAQQAHATRWIAEYPHLVISRSFSKAYGL